MDDTDLMTGAEFRVVREYLGLTTKWLSEHLRVAERTVQRWDHGTHPIPEDVREAMEALESAAADQVGVIVDALNDARDARAVTYRSDADYRAHHPDAQFPASWHRAVIARVAQEVPGLEIHYWGAAV